MRKLPENMTDQQQQDIADKMVSTTYKKMFTVVVTAAGFLLGIYEIGERWLDKLEKKFETVNTVNEVQTSRLDRQEVWVETLQEQTKQNRESIKALWEDNTRRRQYRINE